MISQRSMHVFRIAWWLAEPGIEILDKRRCIEVCRFDRIDIAQPQFLHQPILQGLVSTFNAAFGLRGVGADNVDVQLIERPTELCQAARPVFLRSMRTAENAMLVAVEGQRLAPLLQVCLRCMQIIKGGLRSGKPQMQQLAGGVIDIDEQGAFEGAVLEPLVMRAIDLHELTKAITPATRLENPLLTLASRDPYAGLCHPLA
jgi:hypothetical protein